MKLTPTQEIILEVLAKSNLSRNFYWTGGTLLSYHYLQHRYSFDLVFFTDKPFTRDELNDFLAAIKRTLKVDSIEEAKVADRWEFVIPDTELPTRFEFVLYNHEKKRQAPLMQLRGVFIDSLPDIAANKVMALFDRNHSKDLFDIYTMLIQKKFTVSDLIKLVNNKFGVEFGEFAFWGECTKALRKLADIKPYFLEKDPEKQAAIIKDVEQFFLEQGSNYLKKHLG